MNYRAAIKRELRNAGQVLSRPELFPDSLVELSHKCIESAERQNIYLTTAPFKRTCAAYEASDNIISFHKVTRLLEQ